jgi:hypothetical protein
LERNQIRSRDISCKTGGEAQGGEYWFINAVAANTWAGTRSSTLAENQVQKSRAGSGLRAQWAIPWESEEFFEQQLPPTGDGFTLFGFFSDLHLLHPLGVAEVSLALTVCVTESAARQWLHTPKL